MSIDEGLTVLGMIGTAVGFICTWIWTVKEWRDRSRKELDAARVEAERARNTRRVEATKPFLDRQLTLYTRATRAAAIIGTSRDEKELETAIKCFWQLYWGELAMVENPKVEAAMIAMRELVPQPNTGEAVKQCDPVREKLERCALNLAHACRESLDRSWGTNVWTSPDLGA